ncbi:MAG: YceI family protein [Capnocytophaga granulosa]
MRKILSIIALFVAAVAMGQVKKLHLQASNLQWEAKKVVGAGHKGTLTFSAGEFTYKNNELVGGSFVVDMNTLTVTDEDMDAKGKAKLEGHLKSDDFFAVKKFPTATLKLKTVTKTQAGYKAEGDLTIKGITKPVTVELLRTAAEGFASTVVINRTQYDIKYGSGSFFSNLGDKAIEDNFTIHTFVMPTF